MASDPPTFGSPLTFGTATNTGNLVMGDFDGDGVPDVALMSVQFDTNGSPTGAAVEVHFGDGTNGFRSAVPTIRLNFPGGLYTGFAAADVTGSGQSQLVIAGSNTVAIFDWNGVNFSLIHNIDLSATGIHASYLAVGDLTGPGTRDILVCDNYNFFEGTLGAVWIPNDGTGNFGTPALFQTYGSTSRPLLVDINGDGRPDVILNSVDSTQGGIGTNVFEGGGTVGVLTNNGDGTLSSEIFWGNTNLYGLTNSTGRGELLSTVAVAVADVDGDGKQDLISACFVYDGSPDFKYSYYLNVNLGNGDGTFQDGKAFAVSDGILALAAADINGDGRPDVVTLDEAFVDQPAPGFMITEFSGAGSNLALARQTDFPSLSQQGYGSLTLGYKSTNGTFTSFNNDPRIDIVVGEVNGLSKSNNFDVFKNTTGTTLPPTSLQIIGIITPGGPIHFAATQPTSVSGVTVRIQYTTTTNIEGSWTDLPDGNGGHLTLTAPGSGIYSFGDAGTVFYPGGAKIYFRAITSAAGRADSISTPIGPYALEQAKLTINVHMASTSDPTGKLQIAHIGDYITNTFIWTNIGNALATGLHVETPVPTYLNVSQNANVQFDPTNLVFNSYATYIAPSGPGVLDAKVSWSGLADLPPGSRQAVTLGLQLTTDVRTNQPIVMPNNYRVYSALNEPPVQATGYSSGSANESVTVLDPISFTVSASSATVAPGGLLTYNCTLANLTAAPVTHAVAVIDVPQFTRFATSYKTGPKSSVSGVSYTGGMSAPNYKQIFYQNGDASQVVIEAGALAAHGDKTGRDKVTLRVTFQAEWADPAVVPTISTIDYLGAFVQPASYAAFSAVYQSAGTTTATAGTNDFIAYLGVASRDIAMTKNESQVVSIALQGSLANAPELHLIKILSASLTNSQDDGNGHTVDLVKPGDQITYALTAFNEGGAEADEVFIEDVMPDSSSYVSGNLLFATPRAKSSASTLNSAATFAVVPDPDGHHLRFEGLRIAPGDNLSLEYTVRVFNGTPSSQPAPAPGTFIDPIVALDTNGLPRPASIGSASTPDTWAGFYIAEPLEVISNTPFAQPIVRTLVPHPAVSANVITTSNALTAFYRKTPNAVPLTNSTDASAFFPGFERYYVHYENTGRPATGAKLDVPLPAHTTLLRAAFVKLTANALPGTLGYLPGTIIANPAGAGIVPPTGANRTVTFKLPALGVAAQGDVMVEVIIAPDAIQNTGALLGDPTAPGVTIYDSTIVAPSRSLAAEVKEGGVLLSPHQRSATIPTLELTDYYLAAAAPEVGILKWLPPQVRKGDTFKVALVVYNFGSVGAHPIVDFTIPPNTQFVSADAGQSYLISPSDPSPGNIVEVLLASDNGPIYPYPDPRSLVPMAPHTAAALTVTLLATGNVGSSIVDTNSVVTVDWMGRNYAVPSATIIVDQNTAVSPSTLMVQTSVPLLHAIVNSRDVAILDIGGGNIVAAGAGNIVSQGAGNIVSQGAGNIVSQGAGNIVAAGAGNAIPIGLTTGASLLANQATIVSQGAGNILVPGGATIVSQGAGNFLAGGSGGLRTQNSAVNIVSQGAGNIVSQGAGNIVAQGAGNIVAQGAGNIVAAGAGNIVSQGAGNLVPQDAGKLAVEAAVNVIEPESAEKESAQSSGFILASTPGSTAVIRTAAGNLFGIGGGTFKPLP